MIACFLHDDNYNEEKLSFKHYNLIEVYYFGFSEQSRDMWFILGVGWQGKGGSNSRDEASVMFVLG